MRQGPRQGDVEVVPHDPGWAELFADEAARLHGAVGDLLVRLEHVGSTAVPGLAAKPTVDLQGSVASAPIPVAELARRLDPLGYIHIPFTDTPEYPLFACSAEGHRRFHLHVCVAGSHDELRHLAVPAYLRERPEERAAYAALKQSLATAHPNDRDAYMAGKDAFVKALEQRALAWAAST